MSDEQEDEKEYFGQVMEAAIALREILQNEQFDEDSQFRFMATAPMYFSWILDDLIPIFLMAHMPSPGNPRHHIKAMRMLLCILEESNLHGRVARDVIDALSLDEADEE